MPIMCQVRGRRKRKRKVRHGADGYTVSKPYTRRLIVRIRERYKCQRSYGKYELRKENFIRMW